MTKEKEKDKKILICEKFLKILEKEKLMRHEVCVIMTIFCSSIISKFAKDMNNGVFCKDTEKALLKTLMGSFDVFFKTEN